MRITPADPDQLEPAIQALFESQRKKWGAPLANNLIYARRPALLRGARGMWGAIEASGLINAGLQALVNRRVAGLNGCEF